MSRFIAAAIVCLVCVGCQEEGARFGVINRCDVSIEVDSNTNDPAWDVIDVGRARELRTINKDQEAIKVWIRESGSDVSSDSIIVPVAALTDPLDPSVKWSRELVIANELCPASR